jgi:hypothetical protein
MEKLIDWKKPVRMKETHLPVEVLSTKGRGKYPVFAYVGDYEWTTLFTHLGTTDASGDVVLVENVEHAWFNIYQNPASTGAHDRFIITQHTTQTEAEMMNKSFSNFVCTTKIELEV